MSTAAARPARKPLTAGMIRLAGKPAMATRAELVGLLAAAGEALAEVLKRFAVCPVRVEPDGFQVTARDVPMAEGVAVKLTSARGDLSPVLVADRMLVMALCEAAFGGSGTEPPHDGADRPLSRTETGLRQAMLEAVADKLADALQLAFNTPFRTAEAETRKPPGREVHSVSFIAGRLLVYIFGYSGELTLLFPEDQMAALVSSRGGAAAASPAAAREGYLQVLNESQLTITAALPAEPMAMGRIAGLRRGQMLKLNADVRTTAVLLSEGKPLCRARIISGGGAMRLEVTES
jgi:flagellar motor switch protein FliM